MLDWIREHPYLSGSLAVGGIVLFLLLRRGSSSGTVSGTYGPSESLQAATINAGTQLQMASIAGQVQVADYNARVNIAELLTASQVELARIQQRVDLESIYAQRDVLTGQTNAALQLGLAQVGSSGPFAVSPTNPGTPLVVSSAPASVPTTQQIYQQSSITIPAIGPAAYVVNGGGLGADIHGVDIAQCSGDPRDGTTCATLNELGIIASYDAYPGSYLGDGIYAHTREAWEKYGDPRVTYENMLAGNYAI